MEITGEYQWRLLENISGDYYWRILVEITTGEY